MGLGTRLIIKIEEYFIVYRVCLFIEGKIIIEKYLSL